VIEHLLLEVEDVQPAVGSNGGGNVQGVVTGPGADLEDPLAASRLEDRQ
jgi:hypothetical protein